MGVPERGVEAVAGNEHQQPWKACKTGRGIEMKTHFKILGVDLRENGQSEYEYQHQTACGYVRKNVTKNGDLVDCKLCLQSLHNGALSCNK